MRKHALPRRLLAMVAALLICFSFLLPATVMAMDAGAENGRFAMTQEQTGEDEDEEEEEELHWAPKDKIEFTPGIIALAAVVGVIGLFVSYRKMKEADAEDMARLAQQEEEMEKDVIHGDFHREDEE